MAIDLGKTRFQELTPLPGDRQRVETGHLWTSEELFCLSEPPWRHELIDGELFRMAPAGESYGQVAGTFFGLLFEHVRRLKLGRLFAAETGFLIRRNPDTVIAPDCAFVSGEKLKNPNSATGFSELVPDLVAEVLSPGDRPAEARTKVGLWLDFGVKAVVLVQPKDRSVTVYRNKLNPAYYSDHDLIDFDFVVPGFELMAKQIFE